MFVKVAGDILVADNAVDCIVWAAVDATIPVLDNTADCTTLPATVAAAAAVAENGGCLLW